MVSFHSIIHNPVRIWTPPQMIIDRDIVYDMYVDKKRFISKRHMNWDSQSNDKYVCVHRFELKIKLPFWLYKIILRKRIKKLNDEELLTVYSSCDEGEYKNLQRTKLIDKICQDQEV